MTRTALPMHASWRRFLVTLVASLALCLGVLSPHDAVSEGSGEGSGRPQAVEIASGAHHPGQPVHIESSPIEIHPACLACLFQLQTSSTLLPSRGILPALIRTAAVTPPATAELAFVAPRLGPARAPPSPLVSL